MTNAQNTQPVDEPKSADVAENTSNNQAETSETETPGKDSDGARTDAAEEGDKTDGEAA